MMYTCCGQHAAITAAVRLVLVKQAYLATGQISTRETLMHGVHTCLVHL